MNTESISIPPLNRNYGRVNCPRRISAVRVVPKQSGGAKLAGLTELEPGTLLELCGDGYNDRTVKVRAHGEIFFVFRQDLVQEF